MSYRNLTYAAIQGMLRTLDPHTSFLTPETFENMRQRQLGSFYGLGILVSKRNGQLTVIAPIDGTPASRLGMRPGDVIQTIEGEPTAAMTLDQAAPNAPAILFLSLASNPVPFKGGNLVTIPIVLDLSLVTDASGSITLQVPGGNGPVTIYGQFAIADASQPVGVALSNALEIEFGP